MALALVIPLIALSFLGGYYSGINNTAQGMQAQQDTAENSIVITPILRIYDENGRLLYEKVGDPPTNNLAHLFFSTIAPGKRTDGTVFSFSITKFDGTAYTLYVNDYDNSNDYFPISEHSLWIVAGTGTGAASYNDYTMQLAADAEASLVDYYFDSTTNEWIMKISGTVTFSNSYNITEVGLTTDIIGWGDPLGPDNYANQNVLVFHDLLPTAIQVANGDSISVQYEIRFKLP